jgi:alkylmercury lyase
VTTITPERLAEELTASTPALSEQQQHLFMSLYRVLGEGKPVERSALAHAAQLPIEVVDAALRRFPGIYTDDQHRVIGFWGLSIRPMPHKMNIDGRTLYAWCAWDTLFLPELLGEPVDVRSTCPTTGKRITLTVNGTNVTAVQPAETVLSFVHRDQPVDGDTITSFCRYVHFFANSSAAAEWTAGHPGTFTISLADGAEIARLTNQARYPSILTGRTRVR